MKWFYLKLKNKYWWARLFFWLMFIMYIMSWMINFDFFMNAWKDFLNILINEILMMLVMVFFFMFMLNMLLGKDVIKEKMKNSTNSTKYLFSIIWWMFSTWPVYMWYPFLKELNEHWLNYGHMATFMYASAVKFQFFAVMMFYFWLKYTIIFNIVMVFLALLIWMLINMIFNFLDSEESKS